MVRRKHSTKFDSSHLEQKFLASWKKYTNVPITLQRAFHPRRQWKFDFSFDDVLLAIEIQGYGAGHASYVGMKSDYEKHNSAVELGWILLYFMNHDLQITTIEQTIIKVHTLYHHLQTSPATEHRKQMNLAVRSGIVHNRNPQPTSFEEWINKNG